MAEMEPIEFDPIIRSEVARIWRGWIGMDPSQPRGEQDRLIDQEAARLSAMAEELEARRHDQLLAQWRSRHPGIEPEVLDAAAMIQTAQSAARNEVLESELYPQVTDEIRQQVEQDEAELAEMVLMERTRLREARDPNRWKTSAVEDTELSRQIVHRVWGTPESLEFAVLAASLVQQRLEDNEATPINRADPMREVLEAMIREELAIQEKTTPF